MHIRVSERLFSDMDTITFGPIVEAATTLHQLMNKNLFTIYYYLYLFADNSDITVFSIFLFSGFAYEPNRN